MLTRSLSDLIICFENATLPREEWTHEAHLAVALTFFREEADDQEATLNRMRAAIKRYNAATGVVDGPMSGYHETLTVFWLGAVASFARDQMGTSEDVLPLLLGRWGEARAPLRFYSKRVLMNPTARARFVEPDLAPFSW